MECCQEEGCDEKFDDYNEYLVHQSYHEYHQKIKEEGFRELELLRKKFNLDIRCPDVDTLDEFYFNFPQLPTKLICQWYDCRQEFISAEEFYEHVSSHAHRSLDGCYWENCNKRFKTLTLKLLKEHLRVHTLQKLYACPHCGKFFSTKIKFDDHFLRHIEIEAVLQTTSGKVPLIIGSSEEDPKFVVEEYNVDGNQIRIYRCSNDNCDKAFVTSSSLREHCRLHSNKNKCPYCPLLCKSASRLEAHIRYRHQTSRPFECIMCKKTFKQQGDLRAHVRRHKIVEPFRCDKCDFETLNEENLVTHSKLHDPVFYWCHLCVTNKTFTRGNNFSRHLRFIHKLEPPDGQARFKYKQLAHIVHGKIYVLDSYQSDCNNQLGE